MPVRATGREQKDAFLIQSVDQIEEQAARTPLAKRDLTQYDAGDAVERIRGKWPGDESIDEILDHLD